MSNTIKCDDCGNYIDEEIKEKCPVCIKKEVKAKAVEVEADQPKETTKALAGKVEFEAAVEFNETLRHMIKQHSTEKESLFKLIDSFHGKVIALENRLKIETEKQNKPWYKIW